MDKPKKGNSIAARWFLNSFSIVAVLLIIIDIACYFVLRNYYYTSVRQYIETQANIVAGVADRFYEQSGSNYSDELINSVEQFEKKNYAELMAINREGRVYLSSSGFTPAESYDMPDYYEAKRSPDLRGSYVGGLDGGERIMAFTVINGATGIGIRVITSLVKTDARVVTLSLEVLAVSAVILLLLLVLGITFIRSIVQPIRRVGVTARRLAAGDFSVRIKNEKADEIGELCDIFNYMADELETSENIKNEFISSVSHELRTPLTAIKGWSETIDEIDDPETRKKGMKIINKETERLSEMVEELLDFSRIQNGHFSLQRGNLDVIAELADAVLVYEERARADGVTLTFEENEELAIVYGDKNRLRQVFINIIDNSIKYGKKGGHTNVTASVSDDKNSIVLRFEDDGVGIAPDDLPRVKEKFYKANNTVRGSGIGLAVADEIIRIHGGSLNIDSTLGKGTTVSITLPLVVKQ
ncbi:MAG: HAMP domain-containing histidine kinase [Ruminiclostridium sp.]|nr:HAMP domain-containing histidine kinase [Ruminiclostridium sp.]